MPLAWFQLHIAETIQNNNYTLSCQVSWGVLPPSNQACSSLTIMWLTSYICMDRGNQLRCGSDDFPVLAEGPQHTSWTSGTLSSQAGIWLDSRKHKGFTRKLRENVRKLGFCVHFYIIYSLFCRYCFTPERCHFALFWLFTAGSTAAREEQCQRRQLYSLTCLWFLFLLCHLPLPRGTATTTAREHRDFKKGRRGAAGITFWGRDVKSLIPVALRCIQSFRERQKGLDALWSLQLDGADFMLRRARSHGKCC